MKRVQVINNLFVGLEKYGGDGRFIMISNGEDIDVSNNTVFASGNAITAHSAPTKRFTFRGNIFSFNKYGFSGDNGLGKTVFSTYFSDGTIAENVIINGRQISMDDIYVPPRNFFADDFGTVGFINWQSGNYRLNTNSKYKNKGANGKDPGADIDAIEAEIRKAEKNYGSKRSGNKKMGKRRGRAQRERGETPRNERSAHQAGHNRALFKSARRHFLRARIRLSLFGDVRGKTVLDYGCGAGENTVLAASRGAKVIGVDISPELIELARKKT